MERTAERGLETDAEALHPFGTAGGRANDHVRERLVGLMPRDPQEVGEVIVLAVATGQQFSRAVVHTPHVSGMTAVSSSKVAGGTLANDDCGTCLARLERGA